jgi:hypothetical protein
MGEGGGGIGLPEKLAEGHYIGICMGGGYGYVRSDV